MTDASADALRLAYFLRSGLPFLKRLLEAGVHHDDTFKEIIGGFRECLLGECGITFEISDNAIRVYLRGNYICTEGFQWLEAEEIPVLDITDRVGS
jgi:hypothetical protein